ncbi:hypothetical protein QCA50_003665 [Cerrena zonata]|uniref:Enoyl reductase (ER) domain-containing protein n=1 Tax=Cerrena zonata TaxID=2478898 RepID=A0AAW0GWW2_9APHY
MAVPTKMQALITKETKSVKVEEILVPEIDDNDVLIKNDAIALNPTDWKHVYTVTIPGTIVGCDFSGTIAKVGKNVTSFTIGDRVAGFTQGGHWNDVGAFAEYTRVPGDLVWKIPPGSLTQEEAATFGCSYWTAVQALFAPGRLELTEPPAKAAVSKWILIYGASTSVGLFAIQLAHLAGYKVVTTASPKNHQLAKSLGADAVFDYRDPDVVNKIKEVTGDSIHIGFDTVSLESSQKISIQTFAPGPGKLLVILPPSKAAQEIRSDVLVQVTLIYTSLGRAFDYKGSHYPVQADDHSHMAEFLKKTPELVKSGAIKPNPVKLWPGGLEAVEEGLEYLKEGKNSGEKVVFRIA